MRALITAVCSVGQPQPWIASASRRIAHASDEELYRFLMGDYEVLRMALSRLPDESMLGTAREILNCLLGLQ